MIVPAKMKFNPLPPKKFTLLTTTIIFLLSQEKIKNNALRPQLQHAPESYKIIIIIINLRVKYSYGP
jgi:hypothetical protein